MALSFPKSPIVGQVYDYPPFRYQWDGIRWLTVGKGAETVSESIKAHEQAPAIHSMAGIDWQGSLSHRNLLINGDFRVNQRYPREQLNPISNNGYIWACDRWRVFALGAATTAGTFYNNGTNDSSSASLQISATAGLYEVIARQTVEANNCTFKVGEKLTLTAWVVHGAANKTMSLRVWAASALDNHVAAGNVVGEQQYTVPGNITLQKISLTFTTTAQCRNGLAVDIRILDHTSGFFALVGAQLERGDVSTPMEHRPYGTELALCQRYYNKVRLVGWCHMINPSSSSRRGAIQFPNRMRVPPSVAITDRLSTSDVITIHDVRIDGFEFGCDGGGNTAITEYIADAEL